MQRLIVVLSAVLSLFIYACGSGGGGGVDIVSPVDAATKSFVSGLYTTIRTATDPDGVATVTCNDNESVVGGGAYCSGIIADNNSGYLFASLPVGNSFIGACYDLYAGQTSTPIEVYAICASITMDDAVINSMAITAPTNSDKVEKEKQKLRQMVEDHMNNLK